MIHYAFLNIVLERAKVFNAATIMKIKDCNIDNLSPDIKSCFLFISFEGQTGLGKGVHQRH